MSGPTRATPAASAHRPDGWCLRGTNTCARFFGGVSPASKYALAWQWSGGGGTWNGYGDFDQIDGEPDSVAARRG